MIKDQEFQTKFRGYDTIEVKEYLDHIAEEFFELLEAKRRQNEKVAALQFDCQELSEAKDHLEAKLREENAALMKQVKDAETEKEALSSSHENRERDLRDTLKLAQQNAAVKDKDIEDLRRQLAASKMQVGELKKDEATWKHLIIAAQSFADDLRHKSEKNARDMMAKAHADLEAFRQKSQEELARLPVEIEQLRQEREQVCEELRRILQTHLEKLDFSSDLKEPSPEAGEMPHTIAAPNDEETEQILTLDNLEPSTEAEQILTLDSLEPPIEAEQILTLDGLEPPTDAGK
jgi:DivIVA domain-containing protein